MATPAMIRGALRAALLLVLAFGSSHASAQAAGGEAALAWRAGDKALKWGPCPEFLPKGCGIAVLHGDPAKNNADIFLKVPAKSSIASHWHTSAERMVLVAGEMRVAYDGQKPLVLRVGSYAYGPAKLPHKAGCVSSVPCILFIAFESPVDAVLVDKK